MDWLEKPSSAGIQDKSPSVQGSLELVPVPWVLLLSGRLNALMEGKTGGGY